MWSSPGGRTVERKRIARDVEERKVKGEGEPEEEGEKGEKEKEKEEGLAADVRIEDTKERAEETKADD